MKKLMIYDDHSAIWSGLSLNVYIYNIMEPVGNPPWLGPSESLWIPKIRTESLMMFPCISVPSWTCFLSRPAVKNHAAGRGLSAPHVSPQAEASTLFQTLAAGRSIAGGAKLPLSEEVQHRPGHRASAAQFTEGRDAPSHLWAWGKKTNAHQSTGQAVHSPV